MALATCEVTWITYLLHALHFSSLKPYVLYYDNQNAINIASNPVFHERTKHIEIDCHTIREKCSNGTIKLLPVPSHLQLAEVLRNTL
ncbi:putative RNA-directed DNA polymerase [Lupinus albus]|uniref:Putative RNA-directed DNA polymerase n=1 Tax=Lupinus albus TaxID=3870 RepID=A0A6A4QLI6_LUPAL|nr:putative RNA-directed DNA polymerase [Lupinus albus]